MFLDNQGHKCIKAAINDKRQDLSSVYIKGWTLSTQIQFYYYILVVDIH